MPAAPRERWAHDLGRVPAGEAGCADVDDDGELELHYGAFPVICVTLSGQEKWRNSHGAALAIADVDGDGLCEIVLGCTDGKIRVYK
jgi:hypothetical protein